MELKDTVKMMKDPDFKERFRAEYFQLDNRIKGLSGMLEKYRANKLDFEPKCSIKILDGQMSAMINYRTHLEQRAKIEGVDLEEPVIIEKDKLNK